MRKWRGLCTLCGEPAFEINGRFPRGHVYEGLPSAVGLPLEGATRVTLVLCSGNQAQLTLCGTCVLVPADLPEVWERCVRANLLELQPEFRAASGSPAVSTPKAAAAAERAMWCMAQDLPILILASELWTELFERNAA